MDNKGIYHIRRMTQDEVERIAVEWAAGEGWNPGLHDAKCFYHTDPNGFFVGLLDDEPISCISAITYDEQFAFMGFYIVKEGYRARGYGIKIWNTAMEHVKDHNIGLDGVIDQQPNYMRSGFELAYRNIRYEGISDQIEGDFSHIVSISEEMLYDISQYDADLFPTSRTKFLECWLKQPKSFALAALRENKVVGYSVTRSCRTGYKIGPLFADDQYTAEDLFKASGNMIGSGTRIYLDTPEVNPAAIALAEKYHMKKVFTTARMYTKTQPGIDLSNVYGVTTFELG